MSLEPLMYDRLSLQNEWDAMVSSYHLMDCIECGSYAVVTKQTFTKAIKRRKS